jgi:hypothetical protein
MRRVVSCLLLVCFFALGSGAALYLHELDHQREDAKEAALAKAAGLPVPDQPDHDDNNCPIHRQIHLPMIHVPAAPPLLMLLGAVVAIFSELRAQVCSAQFLAVIDCRGPPMSGLRNRPRA